MSVRSTSLRLLTAGLAVAGATTAVAAGPASASVRSRPIGENQHFTGLVNGRADRAVVRTTCPGPSRPGHMGTIAAGQHVAVTYDPAGEGLTGPGQSTVFVGVDGDFADPVELRRYDVRKPLPTTVRVPCDGPGRIVFTTCTPVMLCLAVPRPDLVDVQFVSGAS